jgi:hypothetical protein
MSKRNQKREAKEIRKSIGATSVMRGPWLRALHSASRKHALDGLVSKLTSWTRVVSLGNSPEVAQAREQGLLRNKKLVQLLREHGGFEVRKGPPGSGKQVRAKLRDSPSTKSSESSLPQKSLTDFFFLDSEEFEIELVRRLRDWIPIKSLEKWPAVQRFSQATGRSFGLFLVDSESFQVRGKKVRADPFFYKEIVRSFGKISSTVLDSMDSDSSDESSLILESPETFKEPLSDEDAYVKFLLSTLKKDWTSTADILAMEETKAAIESKVISRYPAVFLKKRSEFELRKEGSKVFVRPAASSLCLETVETSSPVPTASSGKNLSARSSNSNRFDLVETNMTRLQKSLYCKSSVVTSLHEKFKVPCVDGKREVTNEYLISRFFPTPEFQEEDNSGTLKSALLDHETLNKCSGKVQFGLLGMDEAGTPIFQNTSHPFCVVTVGVQGSGKSHSLSSIVENCSLNFAPVTSLEKPCSTLVFHYDVNQENFCQTATLSAPNDLNEDFNIPVVQKLVILVSPSFYLQRKEFYAQWPNCTVFPLLFKWTEMTASTLKSLMRVRMDTAPPLYMGALLDMLRKMQKKNDFPSFASFKNLLQKMSFSPSQSSPLNLRLNLVESLLAESAENQSLPERVDLSEVCDSGTVVICDLTDPMLTSAEARGIFEVLLEKFKTVSMDCGKLVVFDEAHKYLQSEDGGDDLGGSIIETVRQMRHHGMRVVVSSQSPMTIPDELMELSSVVIMHKFHSIDWFHRLKNKIPLKDKMFSQVMSLKVGSAFVFSNSWSSGHSSDIGLGPGVRLLQIRQRITADGGRSKVPEVNKLASFNLKLNETALEKEVAEQTSSDDVPMISGAGFPSNPPEVIVDSQQSSSLVSSEAQTELN